MEYPTYLIHYGVPGQKWGQRQWQNTDGSLTPEGYIHYYGENKSRFKSPEELSKNLSSFKYSNFNRLMSPDEVAKSKRGSCHDQVMYEMDELSKQGLNPKAKFIMAVGKNGQGGETHSFAYYTKNGKSYWIENAWSDNKGIHEFRNEKELVSHVADTFARRNSNQNIYLADFKPNEHKPGEDLNTFVDKSMNNADEYRPKHSYSIRKKTT